MRVGGPSCTGIDKVNHVRSSHNKTRSLNVQLEHLQQDLTVHYKTRLGVCSLSLKNVIACTWLWIAHFPRVKFDGAAFVDADAIIWYYMYKSRLDDLIHAWRQTISSWHVKIQELNLSWIHCEMTTKTLWSNCDQHVDTHTACACAKCIQQMWWCVYSNTDFEIVYAQIYIYIQLYLIIYILIFVYIYIYIYIHTHTYIYILYIHICVFLVWLVYCIVDA